jgi:hypothetical protein
MAFMVKPVMLAKSAVVTREFSSMRRRIFSLVFSLTFSLVFSLISVFWGVIWGVPFRENSGDL